MSKAKPQQEKNVASKTPSPYGSHTEMISAEWTAKVSDPQYVILEGDFGFYATTKDRLDTRMADPNRYASAEFRAAKLKELIVGVEVSCQDEKVSLASNG